MQRQRTVIFMIVLALALLTALLPAASLPSAAQEPRIVTPAIPSDHSSPESAFHSSAVSSAVMFIENSGQWPAAARFQVWGGPTGTMWLADDAICITVMQPGDRRQATG